MFDIPSDEELELGRSSKRRKIGRFLRGSDFDYSI
jgi:hypothetical protein